MTGSGDGGGKLCRGEDSVGMHYWWCRESDGLLKDEKTAVKRTVQWMMHSISRDVKLHKEFSLDRAEGVRSLMAFLYGRVVVFLNDLRESRSLYFLQDGRGKRVLSYKPVRLAPNDVPLFELVLVPLVSIPNRRDKASVEFRIYESEPKEVSPAFAGHRSGVKKIFVAGKYESEEDAQRKTSERQDADMNDALDQYYWWKGHNWCSEPVSPTD